MQKPYKRTVSLALIFLVLLAVIFCYWQYQKRRGEVKETFVPSVSTNPLDNKPNINPVDQTNPFKNVKTNPFD